MKNLITLLVALLIVITTKAQTSCCPTIYSITIVPSAPSSNDSVQIITKTTLPSIGTRLYYQSNIVADSIKLVGCFFMGLGTQPTIFLDTIKLGKLATGTYQIHYTAYKSNTPNSCDKTDTSTMVKTFSVSGPTGIDINEDKNKIHIYPNPTSAGCVIVTNREGSRYDMYDILGRVLDYRAFNNRTLLENKDISKGTYYIKIQTPNYTTTEKLMID